MSCGGKRPRKGQRRVGFSRHAHPRGGSFRNLEDGLTIDEIVEMFDGLTKEQVKAVLDFAAQSLSAPLQRT